METIDKLIELNDKKTALLKELKDALTYENCNFAIDKQPDRDGRYFLIDIATKKIVCDGTPDRIKRYLNLRKIDTDLVFHFNKLQS